ncbi:MAG: hypothetical protein KGZ25_12090 [Planctomycetes bacterium]|nr:hypothetical protein [Planctomycetota bacterium]
MSTPDVIEIGSRRELFVDDYLIERMGDDLCLRLHNPTPQEVVLYTDKPWEGPMCTYITVFQDDDIVRMYYLGWDLDLDSASDSDGGKRAEPHPMGVCYAESKDGLNWHRPDLGIIEFEGDSNNNIIWQGAGKKQHGVHGFAPFKDPRPDIDTAQRYKAVGADRRATKGHLYAMASPDGVHWQLLQEEPILRHGEDGSFDSQNLAFWDSEQGEYRIYVRDFHTREEGGNYRDIKTATSPDFVNWTDTEWLSYPDVSIEQLYTNQVMPYPRAPHIFVGFPSRYVEREWSPAIEALPEPEHRRKRADANPRYGTAITDGLFMSSRDGRKFKRWGEAFIRPGPQLENQWAYGDNYQAWGMIETPSALQGAPPEWSFFAREGIWRGDGMNIRRYTLRKDGFVSINAPRSGGEFVTEPLIFDGGTLEINFSTSAAGNIRVEVQDEQGRPIPDFTLQEGVQQIGDELDRVVQWETEKDLAEISGRPARLRFVMTDADLYSLRFTGNE